MQVWSVLGFVSVISFSVLAVGCSSRSFTEPRSTIIEKSLSDGIELPSIEAERERFFASDRENQKRLLRIVRGRSGQSSSDDAYRLGVGDQVEISVFDVPELNLTARIRESGTLALPLIGAVEARGRTESQLADELRSKLRGFVRQPQVTVYIAEYGSQKVAVLGAVNKPGTYPLKKSANSILEVLGEAGGVSQRAGNFVNFIPAEFSGLSQSNDLEGRVRLALAVDASSSRQTGIEVYLDQILGTSGGIPLEVPIRGGDMVIVPEAGKVTVEGEVQKPGQVDLGQQMTMLSALASSGGLTYGAKVDEVEVIREVGLEEKSRLIVDLARIATGEQKDVRLRNGDIVRVPSDTGRRMRQDTFEALGRVINFGVGGTVNVVQ